MCVCVCDGGETVTHRQIVEIEWGERAENEEGVDMGTHAQITTAELSNGVRRARR